MAAAQTKAPPKGRQAQDKRPEQAQPQAQNQDQGQPPAELTPAQKQKARLEALMDALKKRQEQIGTLLRESGVSPARFLEVARRALTERPELLGCTAESLVKAFIKCATDGLTPDAREATVNVYKEWKNGRETGVVLAQYIPMYQGYLKIAYRSGLYKSIEAHIVYEGDDFEYVLGDEPFIHHRPKPASSPTRRVTYAYMVAKTTNGGIFREVVDEFDLEKIRQVNPAKKGPRKDWGEQMDRKAPIRRGWKFLPKDGRMERVAAHDDEIYNLDIELPNVTPTTPTGLRAGFAPASSQPPAITHNPGETINMSAPVIDAETEEEFARAAAALDEELKAEVQAEEQSLPLEQPGAEAAEADQETEDQVLEWATAFNQALEHLKTEEQIDKAVYEPLNVQRFARLKEVSPGIFGALEKAIAETRKAMKKGAASG